MHIISKANKNYSYYEHKKINNLTDLLEQSINKSANDIAFFYNDNSKNTIYKTYLDFYEDVKSTRNYFSKHYKKQHIAVIGENSYNWLVLFFGIILSNNVIVAIDKDLPEKQVQELLKISNTKNVFYSNSYCPYFSSTKSLKTKAIEDTNLYINEGKLIKKVIKSDEDKCAAIFFTSGTTGNNKAVMLSEKNIANNIYSASSLFYLDGNVLSVLPFHHAFGLLTGVLAPFFYHHSVFLNSSLKNVMSEMKIAKPNTLFVVPIFIEKFYKQIWHKARKSKKVILLKALTRASEKMHLIDNDVRQKLFKSIINEFGGSLKYIISGGAPLDTKYVKWFRSIGIEILNGYGITECSPVISVNRNHFHEDGSVGQVVKDATVKIENNEIIFKSESVMLGYYNDKKSTNKVLKNGYFYTGDLGYIDDKGFLFITGRKKNLIILNNGENISPDEIEQTLRKDKGVNETLVFAKDNMLLAAIYPNEEYIGDRDYFEKLVYNYNRGKPKNRQIAMFVLRTTEFPKNSNKKIIRSKAEEEVYGK